jgi:hypothetical protein
MAGATRRPDPEEPAVPASRPLPLTPPQRAELERARARDRRPYLRERCAALLKLADGWSVRRVALTGLHRPRRPETVAAWRARYLAGGLGGLVQRPRRGASP